MPIIYDGNRPLTIIPAGQPIPALASRRPFQGWDTINTDKSVGNSIYHSLQVKVERRINPGLSILGAYTWSKALTNADTSGNIFYVYNGAVPRRSAKFDWTKPVDGSNPATARAVIVCWELAPTRCINCVLYGSVDCTSTKPARPA